MRYRTLVTESWLHRLTGVCVRRNEEKVDKNDAWLCISQRFLFLRKFLCVTRTMTLAPHQCLERHGRYSGASEVDECRIRQKAPSEAWPLAHRMIFEQVRNICRPNLQDYNACAIRDFKGPWKRHNVNKAVNLSKKASFLSERSANESAWRHVIERLIVKRLSDELAW